MLNQVLEHIEVGPVWIFTADRKVTKEEETQIGQVLRNFLNTWTAHGRPVVSDFSIIDHQVVILAADESQGSISGCGKDKLNHVMMQIGNAMQLDFFNRLLIPVVHGDAIDLVHWHDLGSKFSKDDSNEGYTFIDGSVHSIEEFRKRGVRPVSDLLVAP